METKIQGIQETLKNLLIEGDLSPDQALHAIAHYLIDLSDDNPNQEDTKKVLDACFKIQSAIEILKTVSRL